MASNNHLTEFNVRDFGAKGDGSTDDTAAIQACINAATNNVSKNYGSYSSYTQNKVFIPGGYHIISSPLQLYSAVGLRIEGAGAFTTTISNPSGTGIFNTNGCFRCYFGHMQLVGASGSDILFNLDWTGTASTISVQQNTFENMYFQSAAQGVQIGISGFGPGGYQADTTTFINCSGDHLSVAGISANNFNSLAHNVYGGIWSNCGIAIWVQEGSIPVISGVGFEHNTWDIQVDASANDCYQVSGCRTESLQFLNAQRGQFHVSGCEQSTGNTATVFVQNNFHAVKLTACISDSGKLTSSSGRQGFLVDSCEFGAANFAANGNTYGLLTNTRVGGKSDSATGTVYFSTYYFQGTGSVTDFANFTQDNINVQSTNYTLGNNTNLQQIFYNASEPNGTLTLPAGFYTFDGQVYVTSMSATSGNALISLIGAGTATMANALWTIAGLDSSTPTTSTTWSEGVVSGNATGSACVPVATGTSLIVRFQGTFQITVAGTIIPSIQLATAAAAVIGVGSYMIVRPTDYGFGNGIVGGWS